MREYAAAVKALELVLKYHPCGLAVLLGQYSPPDAETWDEILSMDRPSGENVMVKGGSPSERLLSCVAAADEMDQIIGTMGGWSGVRSAAEAVKADYPALWLHFVRHLDKVEGARGAQISDGDLSPREAVAAELDISPRTLTEHRYKVPRLIARKAMNNDYQKVLEW